MSLGPGSLQRQILDAVRVSGIPVFANKLKWQLAQSLYLVEIEKEKLNNIYREGKINKSFDNSFRRAVSSLVDNGYLLSFEKKIDNLAELNDFYPYKTSDLLLFSIRKKFIPILCNYIKHNSSPLFNLREIENYLSKTMFVNERTRFNIFQQAWNGCIAKLMEADLISDGTTREYIIKILCRGTELFTSPKDNIISCKRPFSKLLDEAVKYKDENHRLAVIFDELRSLYQDFFETKDLQHTIFKSNIYAIAYFGSKTTPRLKNELKIYLRENHKEDIVNLSGHVDVEDNEFNAGFRLPLEMCKFSPLLDKILDRHVFTEFLFLSANCCTSSP